MESTDDDFILSMGVGLQETIRKAVLDFQVTDAQPPRLLGVRRDRADGSRGRRDQRRHGQAAVWHQGHHWPRGLHQEEEVMERPLIKVQVCAAGLQVDCGGNHLQGDQVQGGPE